MVPKPCQHTLFPRPFFAGFRASVNYPEGSNSSDMWMRAKGTDREDVPIIPNCSFLELI